MKINYKNQDLKIIYCDKYYPCHTCVFNSIHTTYCCSLLCYHGKIWVKNTFNSDIFRL